MERILVGVDGSASSLRAVDFAADLASKYNAELIVLTVVPHFWPQGSIPRSRNTRDWSISRAPQPSSFARPPIICLIKLEKRLTRRVQRGFRLSPPSATRPRKSSLQPKTGRPI